MAYKNCSQSYRTINGKRFKQITDDTLEFPAVIAEAKANNKQYRIDNKQGRIWVEVMLSDKTEAWEKSDPSTRDLTLYEI